LGRERASLDNTCAKDSPIPGKKERGELPPKKLIFDGEGRRSGKKI